MQTTCSSATLISYLRSLSMKKKKMSAELNNELSKGLDLHSSSSPLSPCRPVTKNSQIGPPVDHTLERPGSQDLTYSCVCSVSTFYLILLVNFGLFGEDVDYGTAKTFAP